MNKVAKLKGWLTPAEAARQLTVSLAAPCTPADVLRFGLNEQLVLSVRLMYPVALLRSVATASRGKPRKRKLIEQRISNPAEIWDLPLIGSERAAVEERCRSLAGLRPSSAIPPGPAYVKSRDGALWQLPSRGLPPRSEIVVRSDALAALEASQSAPPEAQEADLGTREKNTLLTVIAALSSLANIDFAERGSQKKIIAAGETLGLKLTAPTISRIVKEVLEAVEDRKSKAEKF